MVRLKVDPPEPKIFGSDISIPYGSIKSVDPPEPKIFGSDISIPYGSIKSS